jgi:hypothetical protein
MPRGAWTEGRELSNEAFAVVKEHRFLLGFPVRAGIGSFVVLVVLGLPAALLAATSDSDAAAGIAIALLVVAALLSACIVARFQGGLVAAADQALKGEPSSYQQGMHDSSGHVGALAGWGLINGTVGVVLSSLQSGGGQSGLVGVALRILGTLVSVAWSAITFFVVPVIVFEGIGAVAAIKRSATILRARWGPAVAGIVRIGLRFVIFLFIPAAVLLVAGIYVAIGGDDSATIALGALLVAIAIVLFVVGGIIQSTVRSVFGVALYRFATDGTAIGPFTDEQLAGSMTLKGQK